MTYTVKEIFLTQQGEGFNIGRTAVFVRFSGCNLWSGREKDRATAVCTFCDTVFTGGKKYASAEILVNSVLDAWGAGRLNTRMVVLTGGEPLLQVDEPLLDALHAHGFYVAVETNGTQSCPESVDWVCVSPKSNAPVVLTRAHELKFVFPQKTISPDMFENFDAPHKWLSPMDSESLKTNTQEASQYCKMNPQWRLAIQAHKTWSIP